MKLAAVAALVGGSTFLAADLPNVGPEECAVITVDVTTAEPTLMTPDPDATAMRLVVYCGHTVRSGETSTKVERALKVIDVDVETAEIIVDAAGGLLAGDDATF